MSGRSHSPETRAKIRATMSSPERRAKISEETKARMADPAVRQRIRDGMIASSREAVELRTLHALWVATSPTVRARFITELFQAACSASAKSPDRNESL